MVPTTAGSPGSASRQSACRSRKAVSSGQGSVSSPRRCAYASQPVAQRALKSRRRRRHSPGSPLAEVEVPERVVDPGRFPVDDAGQLAAVGEQLVLVDVTVYQDRRELGGPGQQVRPGRGGRPAQPMAASPAALALVAGSSARRSQR